MNNIINSELKLQVFSTENYTLAFILVIIDMFHLWSKSITFYLV